MGSEKRRERGQSVRVSLVIIGMSLTTTSGADQGIRLGPRPDAGPNPSSSRTSDPGHAQGGTSVQGVNSRPIVALMLAQAVARSADGPAARPRQRERPPGREEPPRTIGPEQIAPPTANQAALPIGGPSGGPSGASGRPLRTAMGKEEPSDHLAPPAAGEKAVASRVAGTHVTLPGPDHSAGAARGVTARTPTRPAQPASGSDREAEVIIPGPAQNAEPLRSAGVDPGSPAAGRSPQGLNVGTGRKNPAAAKGRSASRGADRGPRNLTPTAPMRRPTGLR
jgi:hypothetical protein